MKLLLAYYAYALDRPAECSALLDGVSKLEDAQSRLAAYEAMRGDAPTGGTAASSTTESTASTSRPGSLFASAPRSEVEDGRLWGLTEVLRSITLKGTWPTLPYDMYPYSFQGCRLNAQTHKM